MGTNQQAQLNARLVQTRRPGPRSFLQFLHITGPEFVHMRRNNYYDVRGALNYTA
jgi:hypothetical protein